MANALNVSLVGLVLLVAACGDNASNQQLTAEPQDKPSVASSEPTVVALSDTDLVRVCRIGHSFRVGRDPKATKAKLQADKLVRLSYTRDDGKAFRYDCMVEGNTIRTRMIDEAGPGSGPGIWSGRGSTTTFKIDGASITIRDVFSDGSSDEEQFPFK